MPNDFEKQVREKMGQLDFVPGEPVWTKIEEQIRQKKDRRKLIFWLPLIALMLGGGVVWLTVQNPRGMTDHKNDHQKGTAGVSEKNNQTAFQNESSENVSIDRAASNSNDVSSLTTSERKRSIQRTFASKYANGKEAVVQVTITTKPSTSNGSVPDMAKPESTFNDNSVTRPTGVSDNKLIDLSQVDSIATNPTNKKKTDSAVTLQPDTIKTAAVKPLQSSKWKIAMVAGAGVSGLANGLTMISQDKSYDANFAPFTSGQQTAVSNTIQPSVGPGFSFSAGVAATKKLRGRLQFSAGLEYRYLSHSLGISGDSSGFFRTLSNISGSGGSGHYTNQYHFIALPIDLAFQPLKDIPVNISAGFAIHQLLGTNAMVYKSQYQAYAKDKSAFTQTQFFSQLGFSYTVNLQQHELSFGPQLNYGLSRLMKNSEDTRLYSLGLRGTYIF